MKLFNFKEEKNKVGRPKLADDETKKKAIISACVALMLVITLALTGAFKLNIINFNKMKGLASATLCTEIPAKYQPRSESNPEGTYEYGFTDPKFYSAVVSSYNNDSSYCTAIKEDELASITSVGGSNFDIYDVNGIQYLKGITQVAFSGNNISSIDLSENKNLVRIVLPYNKLSSIDLSENKNLKEIDLRSNKLSSIDLSENKNLEFLWLYDNNLNEIDLSNNHNISNLHLGMNSNLKKVDLSGNTALDRIDINTFKENKNLEYLNLNGMTALSNIFLEEDNHNLSSIDLSTNSALTSITISSNKILNVDLSNNKELTSINIGKNINFSDLRNNPKLKNIRFDGADVENLDLSNNDVIQMFYATNSKVGNVNLSNNANLNVFTVINNSIVDDVNLSGLTSLENIRIIDSTIDKLNLSGSSSLKSFHKTSGNFRLGEVDFSGTSFDQILLDGIGLRKIDLSNNEKLFRVSLNNNELTEIKIENIPNLQSLLFNDNNVNNIDVRENRKLEYLGAKNNNLSNIDLENNTLLQGINLSYNKLDSIALPDSGNALSEISLANNNLSGILDLSKYNNLEYILLNNNSLNEVILGNIENSPWLIALNNNNLNNIDLSGIPSINYLTLQNNPLSSNIYMVKGEKIEYKDLVKLHVEKKVNYNIDDLAIVSYEDGILKALKEGTTNIKISDSDPSGIVGLDEEVINRCYVNYETSEFCNHYSYFPFLSQEIKVYDITSEVYKVDKQKKTIDASGLDLDTSKIKLTLEGLSATVSGDNFVIKDGETIVDTYKILNMKKVVDKPSNSGNGNNTNNGTTNTTTTKKSGSNSKTTTKSNGKTTTTEDLSDIEINGSFVSMLALQQVKGKDRNIVVKNEGIMVTINGKDIEKIDGNLDLSYELKVLKESFIYNEVKDKVTSGMVLSFKGNNSLPGKALISLDVTDIIKKNAGTGNLKLYSYKNGELTLVAKNINPKDKKLSFYVNELGSYVLTDKELEGKEIKEDTKLLESNDKINKGISFRCILWLIIILIILGIIGYTIYKKNKDKND